LLWIAQDLPEQARPWSGNVVVNISTTEEISTDAIQVGRFTCPHSLELSDHLSADT
jgi:hypothetical protein